ncbi:MULTISPECIES: methyltransferase [unclassified Yoonia]|uniref:methyltransferase n=1 Tax=unclassified Yoonia TaxID=2629118 RepID=UPI002AFF01A5|nr:MULTISPECIES: methyltransferase [unclassified Yoonia]
MSEFPWLDSLQGAAAVDVAARSGLLTALADGGHGAECPALLATLLVGAGVAVQADGRLALTPDFARVWQGDAASVMARAAFLRRAAADVATGLDDLVADLPGFMQRSATFRLFRYDMAEGTTPQHLAATRPWVDYVEALSRSEIPHLVPLIDIRKNDRILEIGGNTGLLAEALIATGDGVTAQVLDLPAVCALGQQRRCAPGLRFVAGDARKPGALDSFRGQVDVVLFKSVLHDWPEDDASRMLAQAIDILPQGGRIVICERGVFGVDDASGKGVTTLANLVFAPFYRDAGFYVAIMQDKGLSVSREQVALDMVFHVTTGQRP